MVVPSISAVEQQSLLAEKGRNRLGNLARADVADLLKNADGSFGRDLLEAALKSYILEQHELLRGNAANGEHPMDVQWDYYGRY